MSLAERLAKPDNTRGRQYCTVGLLLSKLNRAEEFDELNVLAAAIGDQRGWPATDLAAAVHEEGHEINILHIREHRRGHGSSVCAMPDVK